MKKHVALALALVLLLPACQEGGGKDATPDAQPGAALLVGAHYYLWFPTRFAGGNYLRARLSPAQKPLLGEYSSASRAVVEQHIGWAREFGIDFFTLDWWPNAPERNLLIDRVFLSARNVSDVRFCIFYELPDLGYDDRSGLTVFQAATIERFVSDMDQIASRYFAHPRYLRIGDRPVIVLYITRTAVGRFAEAMNRFRSRMAERALNPFVIGDEIFWEVARDDGPGGTHEPQRGRIALFDALTAYNLYHPGRTEHAGHAAASGMLLDYAGLYERYRQAAPNTPAIPFAMPGYNDRGTRLEANHFVIPREWNRGDGEGSLFAEWLERFTLPQLDPRLPMLLVTSWNEWSEDTAIEPAAAGAVTSTDRSSSGVAYTQGYSYEGYGYRYLEVLRQKTARLRE